MVQEWLISAVVAVLVGSVVLTFVYGYLYTYYQQKYLFFWMTAFIMTNIRYTFTLISFYSSNAIFDGLNLSSSVFNGFFLFLGALYFVEKKPTIYHPILALIVSIYGLIVVFLDTSHIIQTLPPYLIIAYWFASSGWYIISYEKYEGFTKKILGSILLLWAFHKLDFPFLRPIPSIAPFGFLLTAILELSFAVGTFILFFEINTVEVKKSEKKYKSLFSSTNDGILVLEDYKIIDANQSALDLTGYTQSELVGMSFDSLLLDEKGIQELFEHVQHQNYQIEIKLTGKNEKNIDCIISMNPVDWGDNKRTLQINIRDITELNKYRQELLRKKEINILDSFSAGIAHDFNNMLMGISGNISLLEMEINNLSEEQIEYLNEIRKIVTQASEMIQQFQQFSSGKPVNIRKIDVGSIIKDTYNFVRSTSDRSIRISTEVPLNTYFTFMTPSELNQVLLNLLLNSIHAVEMKEGEDDKQIIVSAEYFTPNSFEDHLTPGNKYVLIQIKDNGVGMDEETLRNCFNPFYTTKSRSEKPGIGLGLTMVYNIVINRYQGDIKVSSELGQGTSVSLFLPYKEEDSINEMGIVEDISEIEGSENILLIEDEIFIAANITKYLSDLGYTITHSIDGEKGIEIYKEKQRKFDLIILDLNLPKISGNLVYKEIRRINEDIPIIISTGYYPREFQDTDSKLIVLTKPYELEKLAILLRNCMNE